MNKIIIDDVEYELIKKEKKEEKNCYPKKNDKFYFVNFRVEVSSDYWVGYPNYKRMFNNGNIFKTKEEAQLEADTRVLIHKLKQFALENNDKEIDWNDEEQKKYQFRYDYIENKFYAYCSWSSQDTNLPYYTSIDLYKKVIELYGDEIKRCIYRVEE